MELTWRAHVDAINRRWSNPDYIDPWSQMVLKHTEDSLELIDEAPPSGVWALNGTEADFLRSQTHRRTVERDNEAFFLRIAGPGDYLYEGADLGILVCSGRLMADNGKLTTRAKSWIRGIRSRFSTSTGDTETAARVPELASFKA